MCSDLVNQDIGILIQERSRIMQDQVKAFMHAMEQEVPLGPKVPSLKVQKLRVELINEEVNELIKAIGNTPDNELGTLIHIADALADILYVVHGCAVAYGLDMTPIFNTVHACNMHKTTGPVREDGKKLKPPGWIGPEPAIRSHIIQQIDNAALKLIKGGIEYEGGETN